MASFRDAFGRVIRRERTDVAKAIRDHLGRRDESSLEQWLVRFYGEDHRQFFESQTDAIYQATQLLTRSQIFQELGYQLNDDALQRFRNDYRQNVLDEYMGDSLGQIRGIMKKSREDGVDMVDALTQRLEEWVEKRADKLAVAEAHRTVNALTVAAFRESGIVSALRWVTAGDSCPFCQEMNGRIVSVTREFLGAGEELSAGGRQLKTYWNVRHPPLHAGCDCSLAPA